ncbi:glycosyltransferase family 4 protein [Flavobacteriaceae bacterium GSB9]|nr:glycosyltransferase family 4 protein [Flavobacteriaceae bacterium GSB9]
MGSHVKQVLIVASEFPPQPGGIGNHAWQLAKALKHKGYQVNLVTDQRSDDGNAEADFDKTLPFQIQRIKKRNVRLFMYIHRLIKVFRLLKTTDYVLATGKFSLWNISLCGLMRKRFSVAIVHGTEVNLPTGFSKSCVEWSLHQFDKVVAVSNYTKQLISHLSISVDVIPNGVPFQDWQHRGAVSEESQQIGFPKLITVGRVSERKGQAAVVAMLPELIKTFPKLHYQCVGIDTAAGSVKQLAEQLGVNGHVSFHGVLEQQPLKQRVAESDIFVMLSKPGLKGDVEGFGIAVLEANALGVPAIGAKGSGVEDAIKDRQSGRLVTLGDAGSFRNAISAILEHNDRYKQEAITWAKAHDWSIIVEQYMALLP